MSEHVIKPLRWPPLAVSALLVCTLGLVDGLLTKPGPWTAALVRPAWHPPAWVFGLVWALIGICTALAFAKAWVQLREGRDTFVILVVVNALLNAGWSELFFDVRRPDYALADIACLWLSIAALIYFLVGEGAKTAALWLAPYLVWVSIATLLNLEIVRLNRPF